MNRTRKRWLVVSFILLITASAVLHLWRLSTPPRPVFDEAYFATYAAKNVLREPYFDIHPPLGKFILSLPLYFHDPESLKEADYVQLSRNPANGQIDTAYRPAEFEKFPFVDLRFTSVFFGLLFASAVFLFVREIAGDYAGLLALFFVVFENALLLHTRLILMDGIYLALGTFGLYFFFKKKPAPIWGGLLWGLALSVKLTALALIGPVLVSLMLAEGGMKREMKKNVLKFIFTALAALAIVWFSINSLVFPTDGRVAILQNLFDVKIIQSFWTPAIVFLREIFNSLLGYVGGGESSMMSPWYFWPLMLGTASFAYSAKLNMFLLGNSFVWYLSTLAVIAVIVKFVWGGMKKTGVNDKFKPALILFGGYVFALVPFFTIIRRATFLYHYFPALTFAITLAAFLIDKFIENKSTRTKIAVLAPIIILTIVGFLISAPYTYGL